MKEITFRNGTADGQQATLIKPYPNQLEYHYRNLPRVEIYRSTGRIENDREVFELKEVR